MRAGSAASSTRSDSQAILPVLEAAGLPWRKTDYLHGIARTGSSIALLLDTEAVLTGAVDDLPTNTLPLAAEGMRNGLQTLVFNWLH